MYQQHRNFFIKYCRKKNRHDSAKFYSKMRAEMLVKIILTVEISFSLPT